MEKQTLKVQNQIFDLDRFEKVTLVKSFDYTPVESLEEAMARIGGDTGKLVQILNAGMLGEVREAAKADLIGFQLEEEDGTFSPFIGTAVDDSQVNALVLSIAKASCGYLNAKSPEEKKAAKEKAAAIVKGTPVLVEGLKASLAAKA